jgi:UPF0755 protein
VNPAVPQKRRWPIPVFLAAIALLLIALAGLGFFLTSPTGAGPFTLEVKRGTTLTDAVKQLQSRGVIRSPDVFRMVLRFTGADRSLKDGFYDVSGQMDYFELARTFERMPRSREIRITIPEGFRMDDIAARFSTAGWSSAEQLQKAFATSSLSSFVPQGKPLEGVLFPATYKFVPEATATEITRVMTKRLEQEVTPERKTILGKMGMSVYQWVTLASVVQAEAGNASEMPVIAGVFLNRLKIGMALQSDPIIAYGLNKRLPDLDRRGGDFEKDTPYNSYKNVGLPPTPINNPGAAALEAVLTAQRTAPNGDGWLYFLHGRDGVFKPNTNFQAHLRDTNRYR